MSFQKSIIAVIFASLLCIGANASAKTAENWTSVRSKNFFLIGNAPEPAMRDIATRLEQFRETFSQLFPNLKLDTGSQTRILVFKDELSYKPFKPKRTDGTPDDAVAGYFLGSDDVDYIAVSIDPSKGDPYRTIYHEYTHYLLRSNTSQADLPRWLDEGLAQYFETLQVIEGQRILLGATLENSLRLLRRSSLIPLKTFFATDTTELQKQDDASRELFYAQAWAVVHYLMQNTRADGQLDKFLTLLGHKDITEDDLKRMFRIDYGILDTALSSYIAQTSLPTMAATLSKKIAPDTGINTSTIPADTADAYLGDLRAHGDRRDEAEPFLRRAIATGDPTGVASGALGSLLIRQGKFADARSLLEKAITRDRTNFLNFFNLAYAISHEKASMDRKVSKYSPEETKIIREALENSIRLYPKFAESYRLLAFIDFVNGENTDEAVALLKKGLLLKPDNEDFEILLAQVLLTQDKYNEAKNIAETLVKNTADPAVRGDAESVLKTVGDYVKARLVIESRPDANLPWIQSLILLKRSWLTQGDLDEIEFDRQINNLNIILERPRPDENRMVGVIERVSCSNSEIDYSVKSAGQNYTMTSKDFASLRMAVLLEGENSFQIDCGVSFAKTLAVLAFRPPATASPKAKPQLTSISFVPDFFVLKTPEELASARTVVVEDDSSRKKGETVEDLKPEARASAIAGNLRVPQDGEVRETGVLEKIDCSAKSVVVTVSSGGKNQKLFSASPESVKVTWFSPKASQIPLYCGGPPLAAYAVITFKLTTNSSNNSDGELIALEFVPDDFSLHSRQH